MPAIRLVPIDFAVPDLAAFELGRVHVGERRRRVLRPRARAGRPRLPRLRRQRVSPRSVPAPRPRWRDGACAPILCPNGSSRSRCSTRSRTVRPGRIARPARAGRGRARRVARGSGRQGLRGRGAAGVPHRAGRARRGSRRLRAVGRGRRDHVHVVVDGRQLLRRARRAASGSATARGVDRPGDERDGAGAGPAGRCRGRSAHDRRSGRRPRSACSPSSLSSCRFPNAGCAGSGGPRLCAGWSRSTGSRSTISSPRSS